MKRNLVFVVAGLALLVAVGYPAGAWFVGKQTEAMLDAELNALRASAPMVTVSDRKYERGIFSSTETATVAFAPTPGAAPLRFTVTSTIKHLPLLGLFALKSASVDSKIAFADGADVAEWTGGKELATIHAVLGFTGGGSSTITIPAFKSARLSSDEATLKIDFTKDVEHLSMQGTVPRFAIIDKNGAQVQFTGAHIKADQKRFFPDVNSLYSGSQHFDVDQVDASGPGMPVEPGFIKHVSMDITATASKDNEFIDVVTKFGVGSLKILGKDYGPAQFDMSLLHLHARTFARLSQAAPSPQDIQAIVSHAPEVRIDRLSFNHPAGETVLSALFKLNDAQPGDLQNPMALVGKAYMSVDLKIPEKFLAELAQGAFAAAMQQGGLDQELNRLLAEGYIAREGEFIKTKFEFHDAKPWLNGKPYVQASMAPARSPSVRRRGR